MAVAARLRAGVGGVVLIVSMVAVCLLGLVPALPLLWLRYSWYRAWTSRAGAIFQSWAALLFATFWGMRFVVSGAPLGRHQPAVVLSNHRTRLDWAMLWALFADAGVLGALRIVLKADLKALPVMGWSAQQTRFVFLARKWEVDAEPMTRMLQTISQQGTYCVLIFPEGTDLNAKGVAASNAFADKHGLPHYKYLLHPRTRGVAHAVRTLRAARDAPLAAVHDVTLAYRGTMAQNEVHLLTGRAPSAVHAHVEAFPLASLPAEDAALEAWLAARYATKEAVLAHFYSNPGASLPDSIAAVAAAAASTSASAASPAAAAASADTTTATSSSSSSSPSSSSSSSSTSAALPAPASEAPHDVPLTSLLSGAGLVVALTALLLSLVARYPVAMAAYVGAVALFFHVIAPRWGGLDRIEVARHWVPPPKDKAA